MQGIGSSVYYFLYEIYLNNCKKGKKLWNRYSKMGSDKKVGNILIILWNKTCYYDCTVYILYNTI